MIKCSLSVICRKKGNIVRKQRKLSERHADICNIDLTQEELYKVNRENGELISIQNQ